MKNVLIGIQARTTSTRFPGKVLELIGGKPMLTHVIDSCKEAISGLNQFSESNDCICSIAVLVPHGDKLKQMFESSVAVVEGPEDNVLERYNRAAQNFGADYLVRITSDCPLIPGPVIQKIIRMGIKGRYDYCSNVDEVVRTAFDGKDVEMFSKLALNWLIQNAKTPDDQQHVTTMIRREKPKSLKRGFLIDYLDFSSLKLSVDTPEDLERVRRAYQEVKDKRDMANQDYGRPHVHRF